MSARRRTFRRSNAVAHVLTTTLKQWVRDDRGQDLIEYGLLALMIAVACISGVSAVGDVLETLWARIPSAF
jgi:Flp pilus assembly pilin Flp